MTPEKLEDTEEVRREFINTLNRHGYGFQHAVAERVTEYAKTRRTSWIVDAMEFPVAVTDAVTSIDLVLRAGPEDLYLVGECKRVDPALGRWCFARTPVRGTRSSLNQVILEELVAPVSAVKLLSTPRVRTWANEPFSVAVEVRTKAKGDGVGGAKDAIQQSMAQVLRGVSGLANHFYSRDRDHTRARSFRFVPAVFTTADLWVTDADLTRTDLASGKVSEEQFKVAPSGWLWFNYNLSPNLRHSIPGADAPSKTLAEVLITESTRSVAIINPSGLSTFLDIDFADYL